MKQFKINWLTAAMAILAFLNCEYMYSQAKVSVADRLLPALNVKMGGYVGSRLDASYDHRILAQDVDKLVSPFRKRNEASCWQSEFWGKWFTSAVLAYRYRPEPELKKHLDLAVQGLIATQTPDGYIGNYADEKHLMSWDIWGRKYCMLGLIAYYDLTGDKKVLAAACKVADHLMKELNDGKLLIVKLGNHRGMAASSVLEPVCQLYTRTSDRKYLDFAEEIVAEWETPDGPQLISKSKTDVSKRFAPPEKNWYGWEQGQKAYEMMSCYEGLLELYRITGKENYRQAVEDTWENINRNEINIAGSGSAMECWFNGKELQNEPVTHYQETCVTATWIKLSQQLLRLTGDAKYADAIEVSYYNALLGAMNHDGSDWAKYTPLFGMRLEGSEQCGMGLNCCVASGPRGLFTLPLTTVMSAKDGAQVNFFSAGNYVIETPGKQQLEIVQETDYPENGKVRMIIKMKKPEEFAFRVRIPGWATASDLSSGETVMKNPVAGKYAEIRKKWKDGDIVELNLEMKGRIMTLGKLPENIAVVRGPIVLARDSRLGGLPVESILVPVREGGSFIKLEKNEKKANGSWMEFKAMFVPESYKEAGAQPEQFVLCDYASAGNSPDVHSVFKVWLPQLIDPRVLMKSQGK